MMKNMNKIGCLIITAFPDFSADNCRNNMLSPKAHIIDSGAYLTC
jgi:hypothetical protein